MFGFTYFKYNNTDRANHKILWCLVVCIVLKKSENSGKIKEKEFKLNDKYN